MNIKFTIDAPVSFICVEFCHIVLLAKGRIYLLILKSTDGGPGWREDAVLGQHLGNWRGRLVTGPVTKLVTYFCKSN